jgi:cyclic-di-GMP-binding protein
VPARSRRGSISVGIWQNGAWNSPWRWINVSREIVMPSFDIVSELDLHEVTNAIDQANREVGTRFDFKGSGAKYELNETIVTLTAQADFQLKQMMEILGLKLSKRGVDLQCMKIDEPIIAGQTAKQIVTLRQGIETELGKKIQRLIKDSKLKVQAAIQDKQVRVTGKSRDDLQSVMALVRGAKLEMALQFTNFRD